MASSSPSFGSGGDEAFDDDVEALRRACMLTGDDPESDSGAESSTTDDVDLLHRLQERFSVLSSDADSLPFIKPLSSHPLPESDEEDDFETLRAIQRRFTQYDSEGTIIFHFSSLDGSQLLRCSEKEIRELCTMPTPWKVLFIIKLFLADARKKKSENFVQNAEMIVADMTSEQEPKHRKCMVLSEELLDSDFTEHAENESCNVNFRGLMKSQFPKSARFFVDALKKNRSCQKFIRRKLIEIEAKILKERLKCLMDFQVACKKKAGHILSQKKGPRVGLISMQKPRKAKDSEVNILTFIHVTLIPFL
ncbi:putative myb-like protein L [Cocos nucifera]|uniref:Putative myb-like protein L n=1 Tax=Cocos nucifera TaxID=13894 RepID=A0A8K0NC30_COCNU|nr:putative myb-like protein L [Cocos nucifera]